MTNRDNGIPRISDQLWEQIEPLLPPIPTELEWENREAMERVLHILRTESKLRDIEAESPIHEYLREWRRTGVFDRLWQAGILTHDEMRKLVLLDD